MDNTLNADAYARLVDIARSGLAEIEKAREARVEAMKPGSMPKADSAGQMGLSAEQSLANARIDLADLGRSIARLTESAERRRLASDSPYIQSVAELQNFHDLLASKIDAFEKTCALELSISRTRAESAPAPRRANAFASFFTSLFTHAKVEPEGIITYLKGERVLLEPKRGNPQFPVEGEDVKLGSRKFIYDSRNDTYHCQISHGNITVVTVDGSHKLSGGRKTAISASPSLFNQLESARIADKQQVFRFADLFTTRSAPTLLARMFQPRQPALKMVRA
jgi:hypothetical protein